MNRIKRTLTAILVSILVNGQLFLPTVSWAQNTGTSNFPNNTGQFMGQLPDTGRVGGSSFGSKSRDNKQFSLDQFGLPAGSSAFQGPTYQVHILGEVNKPGTYRVPPSTRMSEAIEIANGILERGSQRNIQLRRKNGRARIVDLTAFKQKGDLKSNPYLLDNDVVFIPLQGPVAHIAGAVKRPGFYELRGRTTLTELIKSGGGLSSGASRNKNITIVRYIDGKKHLLEVELNSKSASNFNIENADVAVIPHVLTQDKTFDFNIPNLPGDRELFYPSFEERVFVIGGVARPGPYPYSPYYKTREYLTIAGGFTRLAKEKKMHVISSLGKKNKASDQISINPGDTIVVPERYMSPEGLLQLVLGIAGTALGITTTILALTN